MGLIHGLRPWKATAPDANRLIVVITGGTKIMSAALAVAAQHWPCDFSYIGGAIRDKGGVGIVVDGKEHIITGSNPADALGRPVLDEAITLFQDQGAYAAAATRLPRCHGQIRHPQTNPHPCLDIFPEQPTLSIQLDPSSPAV